MSDAPESSSDKSLLFPAFIYGDRTTCRRKMKALAKKWGKQYQRGVDFSEPPLIPIAPGSVVFTDEQSAILTGLGYSFSPNANVVTISGTAKEEGLHIQWRFYLIDMLLHETDDAAGVAYADRLTYYRVYLSNVCRYAWGALSAATRGSLFNSVEFTIPRIDGVLRHWEALDTVKYIDVPIPTLSLSELLMIYFHGSVAMWVDHPTGDIRKDLQIAVDAMRRASAEDVHRRLVEHLRKMVDTKKDLMNREWLKSPGVIEAELEAQRQLRQDQYDNLTGGQHGEQSGFLGYLGKYHAPTVH